MNRHAHRPTLRATDPGVVTVAFPLRGEWRAVHTPAHKVPSHGTHQWAQTFAYDLWRTSTDNANAFHGSSTLRYLTRGVRLAECPGYGETIHAAFDGTVIRAADEMVDRHHLHLVGDLLRVIRTGLTIKANAEPWPIIGNHAVVAHDTIPNCYALYAHLAHHSLEVTTGDHIITGTALGKVGHTGNSTAPHLHFQLMTSPDPRIATGIPCAFEDLEVHLGGTWTATEPAVPPLHQRIRPAAHRPAATSIPEPAPGARRVRHLLAHGTPSRIS